MALEIVMSLCLVALVAIASPEIYVNLEIIC
jgi:hypothetical protein